MTISPPLILYGTAWKQERTAALVEQALALGFRGIDTACQPRHYHEAGVGAGIAARLLKGLKRSELYLQTKFTPLAGQDPCRLPYDPQAPLSEQVAQSFLCSLTNLQTDYLDGLVLHSPMATLDQTMEVWQSMERLVEQGGVRQLGISNCYDVRRLEHLTRHAAIKPKVVQNRFYAATGYDVAIRDFCHQEGMAYQSFWTLTANHDLLAHPVICSMAAARQRTEPQILFRYLTQIGVTPLTGTSSVLHMRQDLEIAEFALTDLECQAITRLLH
ncbi:MAG: aldo/keto reductase [Magnetococcales bacterium]|nr:aldo/keto reductase [Magnetococcales bacterium]NGZ07417.1 aldo/keto reductase [Magnetococcales bacterium]